MVKSKRAKLVHLTQARKKTKAEKGAMIEKIRSAVEQYPYIYIIAVENMRNLYLKKFREDFKDSKIFFGKNKVMAKALGVDEADSMKDNLYLLSARLSGNSVGLVLTHADPDTLAAYCESNVHADYARAGSLATETVVIPMGTVMRNEEPMPHTLESQLRASGMPVLLKKGLIILDADYTVCEAGAVLSADQAKLLKHFFIQMSEFRIRPLLVYSNGQVTELSPSLSE